jgi:hypothetical protein
MLVRYLRMTGVELREVHEVVVADPCGWCWHRAGVHLVEPGARGGARRNADAQAVAGAAGSRAQEGVVGLARDVLAQQAAVGREAAGREYQRAVRGRLAKRRAKPDAAGAARGNTAGGLHERLRQARRVEARAAGQRVAGLARHNRRAERFQPAQVLVQALEEQSLEALVAVRALFPEALQPPVAPHDGARQPHRTTRPGELLQHKRLGAQPARLGGSR